MPAPTNRIPLWPPSLAAAGTRRGQRPQRVDVALGATTSRRLPSLGLLAAGPMSPELAELVRSLFLGHIGVDVPTAASGHGGDALGWLSAANGATPPLELRIEVPAEGLPDLDGIGLSDRSRRIRRVLLMGPGESLPSPSAVNAVRTMLQAQRPGLSITFGTRGPFAVVNRSWPTLAGFDAVCFGLHPQVHADDDLTIMENLESIPSIIETSRRVGGKRRVHVASITLTPPSVGRPADVGAAPSHGVPREATSFGAAWTLGSIAALAVAGATSATYHGIGGPHGIVGLDARARPGDRNAASMTGSPTGDLFAEIGRLRRGRLIGLEAAREHPLAGFGLDSGGTRHLLISNLSDQPCRVTMSGLGPATAMIWPGRTAVPSRGDLAVVELGGYAWARISGA